jgi:hypothetical protein
MTALRAESRAEWMRGKHSKGDREPERMLRLSWVGLSGLAQPRLTKGGQPYLETETFPGDG